MGDRIVYFTNVPTPYKTGMFNELAARVPGFSVRYLAEIDHIRQWRDVLAGARHDHRFFRSMRVVIRRLETEQYLSLAVLRACFERDLQCAVFAPYSQLTFVAALLLCKLRGVRTVVWYESHEKSSIARGAVRKLGRWLKRQLFRAVDSVVVPGDLARESALALGAQDSKITVASHAVDTDFFRPLGDFEPSSVAVCRIAQIAKGYQRVLLYVGQSVPRKNLPALLEAFKKVYSRLGTCCLLLIGVDPGLQVDNHIYTVPFLSRDELVQVMNLGHGLVLPSTHEVWGLVVNEAAACGLPVLVSDRCGASEMIRDGENGFVFDPYCSTAIESALVRWAAAKGWEKSRLREYTISSYSFSRLANNFLGAIRPSRALLQSR